MNYWQLYKLYENVDFRFAHFGKYSYQTLSDDSLAGFLTRKKALDLIGPDGITVYGSPINYNSDPTADFTGLSLVHKDYVDGLVGGGGATNLTWFGKVDSGDVKSDTGTDATIPGATISLAGLMTAADKIILDDLASSAITASGTTNYLPIFTSATTIGDSPFKLYPNANYAFGDFVLSSLTTGAGNVGIAQSALYNTTEGSYNFAIGPNAGYDLTTGYSNILIGNGAGDSIVDGFSNVALGPSALTGTAVLGASYTIAIGRNAMATSAPSYPNVQQAVAIGDSAAQNMQYPNYGVWIGYQAGRNAGINSLLSSGIGYQAQADAPQQFVIGSPVYTTHVRHVAPGGFVIGAGTTAQRLARDGTLRYNTDLAVFEGRIGGTWSPIVMGSPTIPTFAVVKTTDQATTGTFADVTTWDTAHVTTSDISFNTTTGVITINTTGTYMISADFSYSAAFAIGQTASVKMQEDTGSGYTDVSGTRRRSANGASTGTPGTDHASMTISYMQTWTATDTIKFQTQYDTGGTGPVLDEATLNIIKIA